MTTQHNTTGSDGQKPVAWIRKCSDGCIEGPILDSSRDMCDVRRKSGAWTPLYEAPQPSQATVTGAQGDAFANAMRKIFTIARNMDDEKVRETFPDHWQIWQYALASAQPIEPIEQWEHCSWAVFYAEKDEKGPRFCWAKSEADRWSSYRPDSTVERVYRRLKSTTQQSTAIDVRDAAINRLLAGNGDLYQLLMNVANGIDSPAACSMARRAIIRIDEIRALKSSTPATEAGEQQ